MKPRSDKVRIAVAFGDIAGFTVFFDAITNDEVEYLPFMEQFDDIVDQFQSESGYPIIDTGDGFMVIVKLPAGHACTTAIRTVELLKSVYLKIDALIEKKKLDPPAPDGIRIVIAAGYAIRKYHGNGRISYRGRHINKAHNALDRARGYGIVCHTSFKNLIGDRQAKKNGIEFAPLEKDLWVLKINK